MNFAYKKPECSLTNIDGNVYSIIGHVSKTIRRAGYPDKAKEFSLKAFAAESYDQVLQLAMSYVEVQ